jgi:hypothetical protein
VTEERSGGFQCGYGRYEVTKRPVGLAVYYCRECQRQSGSAFGMSLGIPEGAFRLTSGTLKTFAVVCDSGRRKTCAFCPECGTRIYHQTANGMSLKAGTLDDRRNFKLARGEVWRYLHDGVGRAAGVR